MKSILKKLTGICEGDLCLHKNGTVWIIGKSQNKLTYGAALKGGCFILLDQEYINGMVYVRKATNKEILYCLHGDGPDKCVLNPE